MPAPDALPAAPASRLRTAGGAALSLLVIAVLWAGLLPHPVVLAEPAALTARALGMGNAYTAVAEGFHALYWNPAGLAAPANEISAGFGGLGLAQVKEILRRLDRGDAQVDEASFETFAGIRLGQVALGAAFQVETQPVGLDPANLRWLDWWAIGAGHEIVPPPGWERFAVGWTLRRLTDREILAAAQTFETRSQGEILDLGILAEPTPELRVGAILRRVWSSLEKPEELDRAESRVGIAYHPKDWRVALRADLSTEGTLSYGGEWPANEQGSVTLRVGQQLEPGQSIMTTAGAGFDLGTVQIDLAAGFTRLDLESARFRAELSIRF